MEARWCYQPFEDLILQAKQTSDVDERTELYKKAQVIFKEEAPWVTIAHSIVFKPVRNEVTGFKVHPQASMVTRIRLPRSSPTCLVRILIFGIFLSMGIKKTVSCFRPCLADELTEVWSM